MVNDNDADKDMLNFTCQTHAPYFFIAVFFPDKKYI